MYKDDLGYRVMFQRKYVCGYSRKKLAKLTGIDIEDIRMIENGSLKNPKPQLILNIAGALGTYYMNFVKKEAEDEFLYYLDWGTTDHQSIIFLKNLASTISDIVIKFRMNEDNKSKKE